MSTISHATKFSAPRTDAQGRVALIGLSLPEMQAALALHSLPGFRAKQIWHWIYQRGVTRFDQMANLPKEMKSLLDAHYSIERPTLIAEQKSTDGTIKWLLGFSDGQQVETVFIPEADRNTLCVSSQVGCTLTCRFCHTGTQALVRNLGAHEILQQIMFARDALNEWPQAGESSSEHKSTGRDLTNIVLMGMGEPLYNYDNVARALKICMDDAGMNVSKRRITLSTSGVVPQIQQCGEDLGVNLAISLHAVSDEKRSEIMPINNKYPLAELMEACRTYPGLSESRRLTFEYILLRDLNDSDDDAKGLARLLRGIPCKINLIPFNPWDGSPFESSTPDRVKAFAHILEREGYDAPIRKTRGQDILAACGQLKSASTRVTKSGE